MTSDKPNSYNNENDKFKFRNLVGYSMCKESTRNALNEANITINDVQVTIT